MSSDIIYTEEIYNSIVNQKIENENYINELYATIDNYVFDTQLLIMETVADLKIINLEYEKYIAVYNNKVQQKETRNNYVIIEGDSLQRIALKFYNDVTKWSDIYVHNNLSDIILTVGNTLEIPNEDELESES